MRVQAYQRGAISPLFLAWTLSGIGLFLAACGVFGFTTPAAPDGA